MTTKTTIALSLAFGMAAVAPSARAEPWPPSVVGTWNVFANQSHLTLKITSQGVTGDCRPILGTVQNTDGTGFANVQGFYCPFSGRISFLRKAPVSNATYQTWTGSLSDPGTTVLIGGTFTDDGSNNGEYGFYALKPTIIIR